MIFDKNVTVIHSHEFLINVYGTLAGFISRRPVVTTVHGKYYYWEKKRRKALMRFVSRFSQVVSVSKELRYFLHEKIGTPPSQVNTIYNGIDLQRYRRSRSSCLKKTDLGIKENHKIVGTVGNLYKVKDQIYLLKAIPTILQECPNVIFLFVGRGAQEQNLRTEAQNLGISNNVKFLGFRTDVAALLGLMDVFVLPSLAKSLPLSVLEAMAMCVPSVLTEVGGNKEIIENQKTGYLVPPADFEALAKKIALLFKDKERLCLWVNEAEKWSQKTFQ